MMDAFTCKNMNVRKAPKHIELLGDKTKRPEPAQHIIEFPGGAIELSRTSEGNYWAHILINRNQVVDDCEGLNAAYGEIVGSRIQRTTAGVQDIEDDGAIEQIAVLIRPTKRAANAA